MNIKSIFREIEEGKLENCLILLDYLDDEKDERYDEFYDLIGSLVSREQELSSRPYAVRRRENYEHNRRIEEFKNFLYRVKSLFWLDLLDAPTAHLRDIGVKITGSMKWLEENPEVGFSGEMGAFAQSRPIEDYTDYPEGEGAIGDTP